MNENQNEKEYEEYEEYDEGMWFYAFLVMYHCFYTYNK